MSILAIVLVLVVVGLIVKFAGLDARLNTVIIVIAAVAALFWLLKSAGVLNALHF